MALVGIAAMVVLHILDMLLADTQEQAAEAAGSADNAGTVAQHILAVVQQEIVVPCPLDNLDHIASHSNFAVAEFPALAALVAVLRFPLYLLYTTRLMRFILLFVAAPYLFSGESAFASQAYHNRCVLTSVCVLPLLPYLENPD